jgi:hypothetical protein
MIYWQILYYILFIETPFIWCLKLRNIILHLHDILWFIYRFCTILFYWMFCVSHYRYLISANETSSKNGSRYNGNSNECHWVGPPMAVNSPDPLGRDSKGHIQQFPHSRLGGAIAARAGRQNPPRRRARWAPNPLQFRRRRNLTRFVGGRLRTR